MRICIFGAGAIGGLLGGRLEAAGHDVTLIARGANLAAVRADGLRLDDRGEALHVRPACTDDPAEAGPQDHVVLTMKAHGVAAAAARIAPLLGPETTVVTMQNGLPWWYFHGAGGALDGRTLESVDPGGAIGAAIAPDRVIGGVAQAATSVPAPGMVKCIAGGSFTLGEPAGADTGRCRSLADAIAGAGFDARVSDDIRGEIWAKLWGNVSFSAVAVLTGAAVGTLATDPAIRPLARRIMEEAGAVAAGLGVTFPITIDQRIDRSVSMGGHKTSILQDLEAGRPMEVDAMIGAVIEAARLTGIATPITDMMYAMVRRRALEAGCYTENPALDELLQASERNGG